MPSVTRYNTNIVHAGNSQAKGLEEHKRSGVSKIDVMSAKNTLSMLRGMKTTSSGKQSALTRVINRLDHAIAEAKINPRVRDLPRPTGVVTGGESTPTRTRGGEGSPSPVVVQGGE